MILQDFILATVMVLMVCAVVPMVKADLSAKELEDKINSIETIAKKIETSTDVCQDIKTIVSTPSMSVFGTDYSPNDNGTIFLQLIDNDRQAITDASCYITSWYPDKSYYLNNLLMNYLDDGLYYYDVTIPSQLGVYMMSGTCALPSDAFVDDFLDFSGLESYENVSIHSDKIVLLGSPEELPSNFNMTDNILLLHLNEESGTIEDTSGDGNNGTYNGDLYSQSGKFHTSIGFDATNDYISVSNPDKLTPELNKTYSVWFYPTKSSESVIFGGTSGGYIPLIRVQGGQIANYHAGTWTFWLNGVEATGVSGNSGLYVNLNEWNYLAGYQTITSVDWTEFTLGTSGGTRFFGGKIDEFAVFNRTLSDEEIAYLYDLGNETIAKASGYIQSNPINLTGEEWLTFSSDYTLEDGVINFSVLDENNSVLCSGLGDISTCANNVTPIKLYAELSRDNATTNSTPEIDRWYVNWGVSDIQEIKGAGELNVREWGGEVNETAIAEAVWSYNGTINANLLYQFGNYIWNWAGSISSTIIDALAPQLTLGIYYNATQSQLVAGTIDGGTLQLTQHPDALYDGVTLNFSESAGSPGIDVRMNFTDIDDFDRGVMRYKTSNLAGDKPVIQVWNYNDNDWEDYPSLEQSDTFIVITQQVFDSSVHLENGVVQMRIYKSANGNTNNHYYVDWLAISKGYGTVEVVVNETEIIEGVWSATDRNLTYYETDANDLTAEDVWEYGTRDLTYYETSNLTVNGTDIAEQVWSYSGEINDNILTQLADKFECYVDRILYEGGDEWGVEISDC